MRGLWLRLYVDVPNNRKVQILPDAAFKFWINLLCVTKEEDKDGIIPSVKDIAFKLRLQEKKVEKTLELLRSENLLDTLPEGDRLHDWDKLQPLNDSDPTNAERQRRYRENHSRKSNGSDNALPVTGVTPPEKRREEEEKKRGEESAEGGGVSNDPGWIGRPSAKRPPIPGVKKAGEALPPDIRKSIERMKEKA